MDCSRPSLYSDPAGWKLSIVMYIVPCAVNFPWKYQSEDVWKGEEACSKCISSTSLANRQARIISPNIGFYLRRLCRQMTVFARYHCALNFSLSAIWAKIITPPSHSSNGNGSALVSILSSSSEVFRPVRNLKNVLLENASQAKFVAIFIKALIIGHLNSRADSLSVRHYALPSAFGNLGQNSWLESFINPETNNTSPVNLFG